MALLFSCFILGFTSGWCAAEEPALSWPQAPAQTRITFVKSIYSPRDIGLERGFFKKFKRFIAGEKKDILNKPIAVAVDKEKTIYICDAGTPAVHIFAQKEKRYKKITAINNEELLSPVAVAVSGEGALFIADSGLGKVFCLERNGRLKFVIGQDKGLLRPTGLALSAERLYVVDTLAQGISIFDLRGNFIAQFGRRGRGDGEFNYPSSVAIDSEGKIYIADSLNFRIQVFDRANKFLLSIGYAGDSSGSFSRPKGIAVDSLGHIYVTDGLFDNLQIFNQQGQFLLWLMLGLLGAEIEKSEKAQ